MAESEQAIERRKEADRIRQKQRRDEARVNGICMTCFDKKPVEGHVKCYECRADDKARDDGYKLDAINVYGNCRCACCGVSSIKFLTLDHINNNGAEHRRNINIPKGGAPFYRWLKKHGYPQDLCLQVLCWNCNSGRAVNGGICPHSSSICIANKPALSDNQKLKQDIMRFYGGGCYCCGESDLAFLTIDHINNDGAQQRSKHRSKMLGTQFYCWIRKNNYPSDLRCSCWNCNSGRSANGGVCPHEEEQRALIYKLPKLLHY